MACRLIPRTIGVERGRGVKSLEHPVVRPIADPSLHRRKIGVTGSDGPAYGETGADVIARVRAISPQVLLSFSCGKDSLAAWLAIRDEFDAVHAFYMYVVPGLEFVEESLAYYERFFGCRIGRYPNTSLYAMLNGLVFQPPQRIRVVDHVGLPRFSRDDVAAAFADDIGVPGSVYTAVGNRISDNLTRRMAYNRTGAVNARRRTFWPVFDWSAERMKCEFRRHGVKLPIDYRLFGRSFDGIGLRYLLPIKQNFPRDYARILEWFPLADLEVWRYERQRPQ